MKNQLTVNTQRPMNTISRHIYGHFSEHLGRCIYGGYYVGEDSPIPNVRGIRKDVVEALRGIGIPNLRWPGGCFADEYHWKDGIGPKAARKRMVNTHWGGVVEDNSFGTHEFMDLCEQLGCEPYINGNLGSGTVQEMQEWVEYLTFEGESPMSALRAQNGHPAPWKLTYFGVGNENWGCGGNMRPEYYADEYRRYQTYVCNYDDNKIYRIACGASDFDYTWTETVMRQAGRYMDALTLHYYTQSGQSWNNKGSATAFTADEYYFTLKNALKMDALLDNHLQIMHRYDPEHRVGLIVDEWGTWHKVEPGTNPGFLYQQNTMRDALVASLTLDIFNKYSSRVVMANLAQTINVLQAVLLTDGDQMVRTPTYHVFDLYRPHHDAALLDTHLVCPTLDEGMRQATHTASMGADGSVHVTLSNLSEKEPLPMQICLDAPMRGGVTGRILAGDMQAYNDFDAPERVDIAALEAIRQTGEGVLVTLPPCSVASLTFLP